MGRDRHEASLFFLRSPPPDKLFDIRAGSPESEPADVLEPGPSTGSGAPGSTTGMKNGSRWRRLPARCRGCRTGRDMNLRRQDREPPIRAHGPLPGDLMPSGVLIGRKAHVIGRIAEQPEATPSRQTFTLHSDFRTGGKVYLR